MAISDINPNVIGVGPVSKADLRQQFTIIETELQALYDSTPWRRISRTVIANGSPAHSIILPGGYDCYEVEIDQTSVLTGGANLCMRYSTNGGVSFISTAGSYNGTYQSFNTGAVVNNGNAVDAGGFIRLAQSSTAGGMISGRLRLPAVSGVWTGEWRMFHAVTPGGLSTMNDGTFVLISGANAFQIFPSGGNLGGGVVTIMGRRA